MDWADFARAATDRTAALELSFDGEEEATTSPHPAKVEFWRRVTGSTAAEPRRVMAEAFWMMSPQPLTPLPERSAQSDHLFVIVRTHACLHSDGCGSGTTLIVR